MPLGGWALTELRGSGMAPAETPRAGCIQLTHPGIDGGRVSEGMLAETCVPSSQASPQPVPEIPPLKRLALPMFR